jgi:fructuronate reductase
MERYQNPSIQHRTWQIAMDGTQKLPQRLLGTVRDNLAAGRPIGGLSLAVAGWMRYVGGVDEAGAAIDVRDPMAAALRAASDSADAPKDKAAAFLAIADVFAPELAQDDTFRDAVIGAYVGLVKHGARAMVERAG